jgi:hypothetical protein
MVSVPQVSVRRVRSRSQPTLWSVAFISFFIGSAASALAIWQLQGLYRATIAPLVTVEGTLRAQYSPKKDDGYTPPPNGYYIESSSVGRVYLTHKPLDAYIDKPIVAQGSMSGICGPKSIPCYPQLHVREISLPEIP